MVAAAAAGPAAGSLWWLLKGGAHLLSKPLAQTGITLGTTAAFIPGMQESIKKGVVETPLDFATNENAKHTLNPLQRLVLGDLMGDSEDALTARSKRRQTLEAKEDNPIISEIEGKLNKKYDLSTDPLAFIATNRSDLDKFNLEKKLEAARRLQDNEYKSQANIDNRNIERIARENERQQTIWQNQQAEAQFNALLAQRRESKLARIEQKRENNRLLQMQLSNDQDRYMYDLETKRLGTKGKKQDAVFDALRAIGYAFGL